jgi:uncharacterized protein YndB with AHSA1/START domain
VTDRGRMVREVILPASRDDVWDAVTNPARLAEWFGGEVRLEPEPRGRVEHRAEDGTVRTGVVLSVDRPFRLVFWWRPEDDDAEEGTQVELVLLEHDEGTALHVAEFPAPDPAGRGAGPSLALAST